MTFVLDWLSANFYQTIKSAIECTIKIDEPFGQRKAVRYLLVSNRKLIIVSVCFPKEGHISWGPGWQPGVKSWLPLSKNQSQWWTHGSQRQYLFWQHFIFFGRVDFMFRQPKSAKYLCDRQVRWKKSFLPCINKQFCTSVHIPCSGDFNMNRCSFNVHLGQPSVFISTWFCCHLSQQTKNTISYKKNNTLSDLWWS